MKSKKGSVEAIMEQQEQESGCKNGSMKETEKDLWVIYALADSFVFFSFMQTTNG